MRAMCILSFVLVACTGDIGAMGDDDPIDMPPGSAVRGRTGSASALCSELGVQAGRSPFRRLRQNEYNNAVAYLFGDTTRPADRFPATSSEAVGFEVSISPVQYELYADVANDLAAAADLDALHACDDADAVCSGRFIDDVGLRVWRQPVDADAHSRLVTVYEAGLAGGGHERGLRLVFTAMLQSPHFLYLAETERPAGAVADDVVALSQFERASRLSFLLWQSTPDDALLAAAAADELTTPAQVRAQVERMMDDPRSEETVMQFHRA